MKSSPVRPEMALLAVSDIRIEQTNYVDIPLTRKIGKRKTFSESAAKAQEVEMPKPTFVIGQLITHKCGLAFKITDIKTNVFEVEITAPYGGWTSGERILMYRQPGNRFYKFETNEVSGKVTIILSY